ncbi:unnamed protein product [Prorocentrum cordatum]|uniref:Uncharacterized protein n=1 Tax=Prorocentrum cordatum TaxID=2364126 RepID=A0ABN9VUP0_9DINO|nr:unnamed protein product [Polarella glacialis]
MLLLLPPLGSHSSSRAPRPLPSRAQQGPAALRRRSESGMATDAHARRAASSGDLSVADELPPGHVSVSAQCTTHQLVLGPEVVPEEVHVCQERYDPRRPQYVKKATYLEVLDGEIRLLAQQLSSIESMLARREKADPDSPPVTTGARRASCGAWWTRLGRCGPRWSLRRWRPRRL